MDGLFSMWISLKAVFYEKKWEKLGQGGVQQISVREEPETHTQEQFKIKFTMFVT